MAEEDISVRSDCRLSDLRDVLRGWYTPTF